MPNGWLNSFFVQFSFTSTCHAEHVAVLTALKKYPGTLARGQLDGCGDQMGYTHYQLPVIWIFEWLNWQRSGGFILSGTLTGWPSQENNSFLDDLPIRIHIFWFHSHVGTNVARTFPTSSSTSTLQFRPHRRSRLRRHRGRLFAPWKSSRVSTTWNQDVDTKSTTTYLILKMMNTSITLKKHLQSSSYVINIHRPPRLPTDPLGRPGRWPGQHPPARSALGRWADWTCRARSCRPRRPGYDV